MIYEFIVFVLAVILFLHLLSRIARIAKHVRSNDRSASSDDLESGLQSLAKAVDELCETASWYSEEVWSDHEVYTECCLRVGADFLTHTSVTSPEGQVSESVVFTHHPFALHFIDEEPSFVICGQHRATYLSRTERFYAQNILSIVQQRVRKGRKARRIAI